MFLQVTLKGANEMSYGSRVIKYFLDVTDNEGCQLQLKSKTRISRMLQFPVKMLPIISAVSAAPVICLSSTYGWAQLSLILLEPFQSFCMIPSLLNICYRTFNSHIVAHVRVFQLCTTFSHCMFLARLLWQAVNEIRCCKCCTLQQRTKADL